MTTELERLQANKNAMIKRDFDALYKLSDGAKIEVSKIRKDLNLIGDDSKGASFEGFIAKILNVNINEIKCDCSYRKILHLFNYDYINKPARITRPNGDNVSVRSSSSAVSSAVMVNSPRQPRLQQPQLDSNELQEAPINISEIISQTLRQQAESQETEEKKQFEQLKNEVALLKNENIRLKQEQAEHKETQTLLVIAQHEVSRLIDVEDRHIETIKKEHDKYEEKIMDCAELGEQLKLLKINADFTDGITKANQRKQEQLLNTIGILSTENTRLTKLTEKKADDLTRITAERDEIKRQTPAYFINERLKTATDPNLWHIREQYKPYYKQELEKNKQYFADVV